MRYHYVVAFQLVGVVRPSPELEALPVDLPVDARARLTCSLESLPQHVDQATAAGTLLLRSIFTGVGEGTHEERLAREVSELKERRLKETGEGAFLVFEAEGEVADFDPQPQRELTDYVIALDEAPKQEIRARYEAVIHALLAAFAIAAEHLCAVKKVADAITFIREDGKRLYCYKLGGSASAYVSSPLRTDALPFIKRIVPTLARHQSLVDSARLLSRSLAESNDALLAFLSVWSGLEIFVNKNFKAYEDRVLGRLSSTSPALVPPRLIDRIRNVMTDKYRLADKFSVIAAELADPEVDADQALFESVKLTRDKLLHGSEIPVGSLPIADAQKLLRKYLRLHLERDEA
jgi:hypothetical protein